MRGAESRQQSAQGRHAARAVRQEHVQDRSMVAETESERTRNLHLPFPGCELMCELCFELNGFSGLTQQLAHGPANFCLFDSVKLCIQSIYIGHFKYIVTATSHDFGKITRVFCHGGSQVERDSPWAHTNHTDPVLFITTPGLFITFQDYSTV